MGQQISRVRKTALEVHFSHLTYFHLILVPFSGENIWIFDAFLWLNRQNATLNDFFKSRDGKNSDLPDFDLFKTWPTKLRSG